MPAVYFDSASGSDSNAGTSWGAAWSGSSRQISAYVQNGYQVYLRGSWSNQVGGTFDGLSSFELYVHDDGAVIDCRTRHNSGWTNVLGSRVWKKSYPYQVHRVFLGSGSAHGFTEGSDCAKRIITGTGGGWTWTAASDAQVVAVLDAGSVNQARFWYWDGISATLYVRSTNSSTNPDAAYSGVWSCDGSDVGWSDRRRWAPFLFRNIPSLYFGAVEIRGAVQPLGVQNCSGTIEPFITDFPHYQWETLGLEGSWSGSRPAMTVNSPQILVRRPHFDDDIMQSLPNDVNFDDGNGQRQQGGADVVVMRGRWQNLSIYSGRIQGPIHGGIVCQWYHSLDVAGSVLVQGTHIDCRLGRYTRAFNLQHRAGHTINSFIVERCTVDGQSINSQANLSNLVIRDSVFRNGRNGWFSADGSSPTYVDKYDPDANYVFRWRNSHALDVSRIDSRTSIFGSPITIDNVIFAGQHDSCISYVHWSGGQSSPGTVVRNCWFIRNPALAGALLGNQVFWNDNQGHTITFEANNKHSGYASVPSGTSAMSEAEVTLYGARAAADSFSFSPNPLTLAPAGAASVTVTVRDRNSAAVAGFAGSAVQTTGATIISGTAPTAASSGAGETTMPVVAGIAGSAQLSLRGVHGAARSVLPVTVTGAATGIRVLNSAISSTLGGASAAATLTGLTAGNILAAVVGGYFDLATGVSLADNQSPPGTWAQRAGGFHTGGVSISIGVFAFTSVVGTGTTSVTVTATPVKTPAATDAYISLVLMELADANPADVTATAFAIGQSATPSVDLPAITAPALVIAAAAQSGVTAPTIAAGSGYTLVRSKDAQAGIGVAARKVTATGQYDPSFVLTSTVEGVSAAVVEWPALALAFAEAVGGEPDVAPAIVTATLPNLVAGVGGSLPLNITGTGPFTLTTQSGTPPSGTTYSGQSIVVPSTVTVGTYTWTVRATGPSALTDDQAYTLTVVAAPTAASVTTVTLPDGTVGEAYSQTLAATGTTPITWGVVAGALPAGLQLNATTGAITGIPARAEVASFTVAATNVAGSDQQALTITIDAAPVVPPPGIWTRLPRDVEVWVRIPRDA